MATKSPVALEAGVRPLAHLKQIHSLSAQVIFITNITDKRPEIGCRNGDAQNRSVIPHRVSSVKRVGEVVALRPASGDSAGEINYLISQLALRNVSPLSLS